jgi:hypothetical protein
MFCAFACRAVVSMWRYKEAVQLHSATARSTPIYIQLPTCALMFRGPYCDLLCDLYVTSSLHLLMYPYPCPGGRGQCLCRIWKHLHLGNDTRPHQRRWLSHTLPSTPSTVAAALAALALATAALALALTTAAALAAFRRWHVLFHRWRRLVSCASRPTGRHLAQRD